MNKDESQIRIIGGKWRSRKIIFPSTLALRPTPNRIRETLFNWLAPSIVGAHCLDLFAGSGALGFEAVSRGAQNVVMVDSDPKVVSYLLRNREMLQMPQIEILNRRIPDDVLNAQSSCFDVVFLDPPYRKNLIRPSIDWLLKNHYVKKNTIIYVETEADYSLLLPETWQVLKSKKTSSLAYYLISGTGGSE